MDFDPVPFDVLRGLLHWLLVLASVSAVALVIATLVSIGTMGLSGPGFILGQLGRTLKHFALALSGSGLRRVSTIAGLTLKEAVRRKALWIFAIFALLFMFAGWFLSGEIAGTSDVAKPYITFVLTVINGLSLPLAILLACWGLPQDIKDRSLHTVVTKPVRRVEIVMGRMLGYSLVTIIVVGIMSAIGYLWIKRTVPDYAQDELIGRVPIRGELVIIGRDGQPGGGVNVGDIWERRRFVDGNSQARGIYTFDDLPLGRLRDAGRLRLEYDFEVFRTYKGDIETGVLAQFAFVNDRGTEDESDDLIVRYPDVPFEVKEFTTSVEDAVESVPAELLGPSGDTVELFKVGDEQLVAEIGEARARRAVLLENGDEDEAAKVVVPSDGLIAPDGSLTVSVRCVDDQQYLGLAQTDLFIRLPDRSFAVSYFKAALGIMLQAILLVIIGTTASCVVKGPVATFLTLGIFVMGLSDTREYVSNELFAEVDARNVTPGDDTILGGGPIESVYRLVTGVNQSTALADTSAVNTMQAIDKGLLGMMRLTFEVVPDLRPFNTLAYLQSGFDIPWNSSILPSLATTLAFLIPCIVLGALCLQLRELEAK